MKQLHFDILIAVFVLGFINPISAQVTNESELLEIIKQHDSLIFTVGFNTCDMSQFEKLLTDDIQFYHDKGGVMNSKEEFIKSIKNGICQKENPYKSRRELIEGSLEVYTLYDNGELYGAIQNGEHQFYEGFEGKEKSRSRAKFSHLWLLQDKEWKLKTVFSFDHQL
ncbi:MAG: nuclear transport factor 2 family protein [Aquaticitalea sp.]